MNKIEIIKTHNGKVTRENKYDSGFDVYCVGYRRVTNECKLEPEVWFDEISTNTITVEKNETIMLLTGIQLKLPTPEETENGYKTLEIQVRGRSGLSLKNNTNVKLGTGDNQYRGMYGVIFKNESNKTMQINNNDKIAQLVFNEVYIPKTSGVIFVDKFNNTTSRGDNGFGSSGK